MKEAVKDEPSTVACPSHLGWQEVHPTPSGWEGEGGGGVMEFRVGEGVMVTYEWGFFF